MAEPAPERVEILGRLDGGRRGERRHLALHGIELADEVEPLVTGLRIVRLGLDEFLRT